MQTVNDYQLIDLNDYVQYLNPYKGKSRTQYECPACNGKLDFNKAEGTKFSCFDCGDRAAIRKTLRALSGEDKAEHTPLTQEERREFAIAREQKRLDEAEAERLRLTPSSRRDLEMRVKITDNPLTARDRKALNDRGLSNEFLEANEFYSEWGGWSCPAVNFDGERIAGQFKPHGGKGYKYVAKGQVKRHETGQNPITVHGNRINPTLIAVVEGLTIKPCLTAWLHPDWLVIGVSGAQFLASSKEVLDVIGRFPEVPVVLMPDGGSTNDQNICRNHDGLKNLLGDRELQVGWWGQYEKGGTDIDEIGANAKIDLISWEDFIAKRTLLSKLTGEAKAFYTRMLRRMPRQQREVTSAKPQEVKITYKADRHISYEYGEDGVVVYDVSDLRAAIESAIASGYKVSLDLSAAGKGKSTAAAMLREIEGIDRIILVTNNFRNPTTAEAEEYFHLFPSRVFQYYVSKTEKTALGSPVIRTSQPKTGEWSVESGNCKYAAEQAILAQSGYDRELTNPICGSCEFAKICHVEKGNGYGYWAQLQAAMLEPRLRMAPAHLGIFLEKDLAKTLIIFDDEKLVSQKELKASRELIANTAGKISMSDPELSVRLSPIFSGLNGLFDRKEYYGLDHFDVTQAIGEIDVEALKSDMSAVMEILQPSLWNLKIGSNHKADESNRKQYGKVFEDKRLDPKELEPNWFMWFLEILCGRSTGHLRIGNKQLIVMRQDTMMRDVTAKAAMTLHLDATQSAGWLALHHGIEESEVMTIGQNPPDSSNLFVHVLENAGTPNKERRRDTADALAKTIEARHGKTSIMDKKGMGDGTRGVQFGDSRGSNKFQEDNAMLQVGNYCVNLGAVAAEYSVLTGGVVSAKSEDEGYKAYLRHLSAAEQVQSIGRLRAHLRPEKQLHYYIHADTPNLPLAEVQAAYPGATIVYEQMIDVCVEAADKRDQLRLALVDVLAKTGTYLTQKQLAGELQVGESDLSKMLKPFGGYKKTCQTLLEISIAKGKFLNSELIDWSTLIEPTIVDYTIQVLDGGDTPLETAEQLEAIIEPMPTDKLTALFGCVGKQRMQLIIDHLFYLQVHRDTMKLIETGDTIEELADGLRYIVLWGDVVALENLRDKHFDDKESMQVAAKMLTPEERGHLNKMVEVGNASKALRANRVELPAMV